MKQAALLSVLIAAAILAGCNKSAPPPAPAPPADPTDSITHAQPRLQTLRIYLGAESFDAELALTPKQEQTGMMFRTNIPETDAMLFPLGVPQQASFWMKNCPESISAAYINRDGIIEEIHHLEHDDTNAVLSAHNDILFVLETKDGWFARHNIGVGTAITSDKGALADIFTRR